MPEEESEKTTWKRHKSKAKKIIIDVVRDHILPSIARLKTAYKAFKTIKDPFEINNKRKILTLKHQLLNIKINKGKTITTYFLRISEIRDQLATIGNNADDEEVH